MDHTYERIVYITCVGTWNGCKLRFIAEKCRQNTFQIAEERLGVLFLINSRMDPRQKSWNILVGFNPPHIIFILFLKDLSKWFQN